MDLEKALQDANAEKLALDQLYVDCLKNNLLVRKELILKTNELNQVKDHLKKLQDESELLLKENSELKLPPKPEVWQ